MPNQEDQALTDTDRQPAPRADASSQLALVRTRLAYENTMLGWVRTSTSLITFGFGVHQFFRVTAADNLVGIQARTPHAFGSLMVLIGLVALVFSAIEHRNSIARLNARYQVSAGYLPAERSYARVLGALTGLLGVGALIIMQV